MLVDVGRIGYHPVSISVRVDIPRLKATAIDILGGNLLPMDDLISGGVLDVGDDAAPLVRRSAEDIAAQHIWRHGRRNNTVAFNTCLFAPFPGACHIRLRTPRYRATGTMSVGSLLLSQAIPSLSASRRFGSVASARRTACASAWDAK